jgi:hypothetical protein
MAEHQDLHVLGGLTAGQQYEQLDGTAWQAAASGTPGPVGFLLAVLGTMLLAGAWWLEAFAVPYAAAKAPALAAEQVAATHLV